MRLITLSEDIQCDHDSFLALHDAVYTIAEDFNDTDYGKLSKAFLRVFPPTRAGEPRSGLWDFQDNDGLGPFLSPWYSPIGFDVEWQQHRAWVHTRNSRAHPGALVDLLRHVCSEYLPLSLTWLFQGETLAPGSLGAVCVLVDEANEKSECTWNWLHEWGERCSTAKSAVPCPTADEVDRMSRDLVSRVRKNALQDQSSYVPPIDGSIVVYIPGDVSPAEHDKTNTPVIRSLVGEAGILQHCRNWLRNPGLDTGGYSGFEAEIHAKDLDLVLGALRNGLPHARLPRGTQLQYKGHSRWGVEEFDGSQWSEPSRLYERVRGCASR